MPKPAQQRISQDRLIDGHSRSDVSRVMVLELAERITRLKTKPLPPLTRAGFYLAIILLSYISIVTIVLFVDYFMHAPSLPPNALANPDSIERYKALSQLNGERLLNLFENVIQKTFLPVLTTILGYIFGARSERRLYEEKERDEE